MLDVKQNEIQWLRAIAALEVVTWHSDLITKHFSGYLLAKSEWYQPFGGIGVELFFILSGYVICMRAPSYGSGAKFMLSRVARLFPMYWIFTSLTLVAFAINPEWRLHGLEHTFPRILQSYLILPQADEPILGLGWTLEHEMIFYAFVALLMGIFGALTLRTKMHFFFFIAGLGLGGFAFATRSSDSVWASHVFTFYMFAFAFGWLMRCLDEAGRSKTAWTIGLLIVIGLTALWLANERDTHIIYRTALVAIVFTAFSLWRSIFAKNNLFNRWASKIGDASYSLYLSHWFVLSILGKVLGVLQPPPAFDALVRFLGVALCIFVSLIIFRYIEKPIDRLLRGDRSSSRTARPSVATTRPAADSWGRRPAVAEVFTNQATKFAAPSTLIEIASSECASHSEMECSAGNIIRCVSPGELPQRWPMMTLGSLSPPPIAIWLQCMPRQIRLPVLTN